jgi:hypothetical protein
MQIVLVAAVLFAGMWFTVLRPKSDSGSPAPAAQPQAPGVRGLANDVAKAKAASATSDAANANIQKATGGDTTAQAGATAAKPAATKATPAATKPTAKAKPAATAKAKAAAPAKKPAATVGDPSDALLSYLTKGKTVVLLFHSDGADDRAARRAVHKVALADKHVVAAYAPITRVGAYRAITSDIEVSTAPTILVIGANRKATVLTGFVDPAVIEQAVGDARRAATQARAAKK